MAIQISGSTVINDSRQLSDGLISAYDTVSSGGSTTIGNRTVYYVTSSGRTITLPQSPEIGNEVVIVNGNYTNTSISPGASYRIMSQSLAESMIIDFPYAAVRLIYIDSNRGWTIA